MSAVRNYKYRRQGTSRSLWRLDPWEKRNSDGCDLTQSTTLSLIRNAKSKWIKMIYDIWFYIYNYIYCDHSIMIKQRMILACIRPLIRPRLQSSLAARCVSGHHQGNMSVLEYPKSQRFSLFLEVKVQLVTRSPKYPPYAMHHGEHGDCGNTVLLYSLWSQTEPSTKDALARSASKNSDMAVVLPQFSG